MGQILELFKKGGSGEQITIDFEKVQPSEGEMSVWNDVDKILQRKDDILRKVSEYRGQEELIRKAISERSEPDDAEKSGLSPAEEEAWKTISGQADIIAEFYRFAVSLQEEFPKIIKSLSETEAKVSLTEKQALCKQLGIILDFVLAFDNKKVTNPGIQNDFSYFRRSFARMKQFNREEEIRINDEEANRISLFIANPSPMMSFVVNFIKDTANGISTSNLCDILALFANVCNDMVGKGVFENKETSLFCLRVMTGCIILNDHLSEQGSFYKKSPINIKECIMQLKNFGEDATYTEATNSLLDTIRYTCEHVNDPETPGYIRALLI